MLNGSSEGFQAVCESLYSSNVVDTFNASNMDEALLVPVPPLVPQRLMWLSSPSWDLILLVEM